MAKIYSIVWDITMALAFVLSVYHIYRLWPRIVSGLI